MVDQIIRTVVTPTESSNVNVRLTNKVSLLFVHFKLINRF